MEDCAMRGFSRRSLVALTVFATVLASCGTQTGPSGSGGTTKTTAVIVQGSEPDSLAPDIDAIRTSVRVHNHIFEAATKYSWDGSEITLEPSLTDSWEQVEPNRWRFHVHPGIKFHNGEALTAEAFKFSLDTYIGNKGMVSTIFADRQIEVVDDMTFDVVTDADNFAALPATMSFLEIYPPQYYAEVGGSDEFGIKPVGTGPYKFVSWNKGVEIKLAANADYWGEQKPQIQELIFRSVPDAATRVAQLETGEADLITDLPPELADRVENLDDAHTVEMGSNRRLFFFFNTFEGPTADVRVRQAVNYAVDRQSIIDNLFNGHAGPINGIYLPGEAGYNPDFAGYEFNPDKARELLADAGYADGVEIDLHYTIGNTTLDKETAEVIQGQLAEVGITANMDGRPVAALSQDYANQTSTGMNMWSFAPVWFDPSFIMIVHFSSTGLYRYNASDEQDALIADAFSETDPDTRVQLYQDLENYLIMEKAVWLPLYAQQDIYGVSDSLNFDQNARPDQLLDMEKASFGS
jgi:peptide/nickel transport system substrate-binding protein